MHRLLVALCAALLALPVVGAQIQPSDAVRDAPLAVARDQLRQARSLVLQRKYDAAVSPLSAAADALACFEEQDLGRSGREAGDIRQAILDYSASIDTDHADALPHIDAWLQQIGLWDGGQ